MKSLPRENVRQRSIVRSKSACSREVYRHAWILLLGIAALPPVVRAAPQDPMMQSGGRSVEMLDAAGGQPQQKSRNPEEQPAGAGQSQQQSPDGEPSATPTVVLDDTHTLPTAKPPAEKTPVPITKPAELTDFQQLVESSLGQTLPIYGENLFEHVPTTFAPVDRVPVTADYVIGPGDELLIRAWGQIDLDVHARVDRNGAIYIPKVGSLNVAGLRYDQLQGFLKSHIGHIYQNFDLRCRRWESCARSMSSWWVRRVVPGVTPSAR